MVLYSIYSLPVTAREAIKIAQKGLLSNGNEITDYSRQQLSRLINQHKKSGYVGSNVDNVRRFALRYTKDDVQALVAIDEMYGTLNGIATKKLCERSWYVYNDARYERLARISVALIT